MDTFSESKRYNDHMCNCKNILNKMKLLLNFTELPSDILIQTRESLKELNTITNDLLELKDGRTSSKRKLNETNEMNSENRNVTQKCKFSLPKIKVENIEKDDTNLNSDSKWEPDALPYNASFMSLALSANELEGVESKVSQICDSPSQTYEEKYKILRSVFFREKINHLNINNTSTCFSPVCWTRNLNCKKDALSLISNDSKPKSIRKKKYTFGPTNFIAMQANIPTKNNEDDESDEDEPEKIFKDVSVNTKRIKYRQVSNKRVDKNNSCDSQCPYEPSVESLPFELIEYEVSQKHYVTKNLPKKLKEFTRSSLNKIFDKRDGRRKNDKYPYEPSQSSLPVEFKSKDMKPEVKESKVEEKDTDSTISVSSDEDDEISNKEIQIEEIKEKKIANLEGKPGEQKVRIPCDDKTCADEDSDEETESDESVSLISIPKDEEDSIDDIEDYEFSDKSSTYEENDEGETESQNDEAVTTGTDENKIKSCIKSTCNIEKCTNNKNKKGHDLQQQAELNDEEYEKMIDSLTEQIIPSSKDKIYYEKGETKNKDNSKRRDEPKQPTVKEYESEKVTKKDKMSDDHTKQIAKKCPAETGIYDQEYTKCPAEKCINKDQNKESDKRKSRTEKKIIEDDIDIYEEPETEAPLEEIKDAGRKTPVKCKIPIKCPRENCTRRHKIKVQDKQKPEKVQVDKEMVEKDNEEQENIAEDDKMSKEDNKDDDEKMTIKGNDETTSKKSEKEISIEEIKGIIKKSPLCPSEKCRRSHKTKRDKSIPKAQEDEIIEILEKKEIVKYRNTNRNMIQDDNVAEDENMTEEGTKDKETEKDISVEEINDETNKSLILEENEEKDAETQDQNEGVTEEMDENEMNFCVKNTCKIEKCLTKNNDSSTEQKLKCPKDIGKIYSETQCEGMLRTKDKSIKRSESKQPTVQEAEIKCPSEKRIKKDEIKKHQKPKLQRVQVEEKEEKDEDIYEEPIEIECPSEKCKKNKTKKRNKATLQTTVQDDKNVKDIDIMTEDENVVLPENTNEEKDKDEENEMSDEEVKDASKTAKCPKHECPSAKCRTKNKTKNQDKRNTQTVQVHEEIVEEIAEDGKMTEESDDNDESEKESSVEGMKDAQRKCPTQIAKLSKRCPAEKRRRTSVDQMTETEEPKVQETKQSNTDCVQIRSTGCNTNPLPIIQDEATSTVQEGMKIKDMHAWALAYVKLEDDGAKLVQILHTTPYEPGRYLFREPNELILFGPQASSSKKSK